MTAKAAKSFLQIQKLADRIMAYSAEDAGIKFSGFDPRFSEEENKISMVMKLIQTFSIHVVEEEIDAILQKYGLRGQECVLSLGGGYALNCPTNTYLMQNISSRIFCRFLRQRFWAFCWNWALFFLSGRSIF